MLRTLRFATLVLTALSMGTALCHLLEMPAKVRYEGALWLTLLQTLYPPAFGSLGAFFEVAAIVAAGALVFVVRHDWPAFGWTIIGAICLILSHAAFWIWVAPVNAALLPLTPDTLPAGWAGLRDQWEYTHAARALLQIVALGALVLSILVDTPSAVLSSPPTPTNADRQHGAAR